MRASLLMQIIPCIYIGGFKGLNDSDFHWSNSFDGAIKSWLRLEGMMDKIEEVGLKTFG